MVHYTLMQNVKIVAGPGTIALAGEILSSDGYKKALIAYDKGIKSTGVIDKVIKSLAAYGMDYVEFDKVVPDPPADMIEEGYAVCKKEACDCVIGVGGGSALDSAKGINLLRVNGGHILDYINHYKEGAKCPGCLNVPTTSGTGAELSSGIMVSDPRKNSKECIEGEQYMSDYIVIDPELTVGMPKGLTTSTGIDAFSHAAEAYTGANANILTDYLADAAMRSIVKYLPRAAADGSDMEARTNMHVSASMGGILLKNCACQLGHSVAHVLGGFYHVPHGILCAYSLPVLMETVCDAVPEKVKNIGFILGAAFTGAETNAEIGKKTSDAYKKFAYETLHVPKVSETIKESVDKAALCDAILHEPLANFAPIQVTKEIVADMLDKVFEG